MPADRLAYNVGEAVALLGVSAETIHRALRATDGTELRGKRIGKRILIPAAELHAWADALPARFLDATPVGGDLPGDFLRPGRARPAKKYLVEHDELVHWATRIAEQAGPYGRAYRERVRSLEPPPTRRTPTSRRRRQYGSGSITQRADGKWVGRFEGGFTKEGGRRRLSVVADTEAKAKTKLRDKMREVAQSGAGTTSTRDNVKVWSEKWLAIKQAEIRPKTWAGYQSAVKTWIWPTIGHRRLDQLTPADIRAVSMAARKAGRSSSTARLAHVVLVEMLKAAQREGYPVPPRALLVDAPSPGKGKRSALELPDALAVLKVAAGDPGGSRWVAGLLQGMRQGECLGLTWDLVDTSAGWVDVSWQLQEVPYAHGCNPKCGRRFGGDCPDRRPRIPDGFEMRRLDGALCLTRPKTAKGQRIIPLVPWMRSSLDAWRSIAPASPHGLVWPRPDGRPQLARADASAWVDLQARADVRSPFTDEKQPEGRPYKVHEMRHTTATLLAEAGVDPSVIMAILGHSTVATQAVYKTVRLDVTAAALTAVAERLGLVQDEDAGRDG